jgi:flavonol-3-O-glucoside/galactoside glucosyltransferase
MASPFGSETTADLPFSQHSLLMTAMDLTEPIIEDTLRELRPHMVFFDFTYWLPALACQLGIKALHYCQLDLPLWGI